MENTSLFMLSETLGITKERASEIAERCRRMFAEGDEDMAALCKAVAKEYDPEAVLVGSLIEQVCFINNTLHAAEIKTNLRSGLN